MKTLSKKERHAVYIKALEGAYFEQTNKRSTFLCNVLKYYCNCTDIYKLKEFHLFAPTNKEYGAWFVEETGYPETYESEIIKNHQLLILMFCIEMTKD